MQLATEIKRVKKLPKSGNYRLLLSIVDTVADTAKIARRLKKREISIVRHFPAEAPEPRTGELIVLDRAETAAALVGLSSPKKMPTSRKGEIVSAFEDFDRDGHPELHVRNGTVSLDLSPVRGGLITHFAKKGREGLVDNRVVTGINSKIPCGITFAGFKSKGFNPENTKFKVDGYNEGDIKCQKSPIAIQLKGKCDGLDTRIALSLAPDSPILGLEMRIQNKGKKAKAKKIHPALSMHFLPLGHRNCDISLRTPSGKTRPFALYPSIPVWMWTERWFDYTGNINTGKSGFIVARRKDTGEGLVFAFDPNSVARVWHERGAPLPKALIIGGEMSIPKNGGKNFACHLSPLDRFEVGKGYLLGTISDGKNCHVVLCGPESAEIFAIIGGKSKRLELVKVGETIFRAKLRETPERLELPIAGISLKLDR